MDELVRKRRQLVAIYLLWIFINIVVWASSNGENPRSFWPDSEGYEITEVYDFSEFLVYTIGPIVILVVYSIFTGKGVSN